MVISQTVQAYVYCIHLLETLPSVFENSARGMLVQELMPFTLSCWPFFFGHCLLSLFLLSCQVSSMIRRATCQFTHEKRSALMSLEFDFRIDSVQPIVFLFCCCCFVVVVDVFMQLVH